MEIVAKLVPPHSDKHWSFQVINVSEDQVLEIRRLFSNSAVRAANPFLQGNSRGWVMVEFWTADKSLIDAAASVLFDLLKQPHQEGNFTRQELGL